MLRFTKMHILGYNAETLMGRFEVRGELSQFVDDIVVSQHMIRWVFTVESMLASLVFLQSSRNVPIVYVKSDLNGKELNFYSYKV